MSIRTWLRRKSGSPASPRNAALGMVALQAPVELSPQSVIEFLTENWSDLPSMLGVEGDGRTFTVQVRGGAVACGYIPAPIPWSDLESACGLSWQWPHAASVLRDHSAHVVVFVSSTELDLIAVKILLTKVLAAVAAVAGGSGVYLGDALLVHEARSFIEQARDASRSSLPILLWLQFQAVSMERGVSTYTLGLTSFGLQELETIESRRPTSEIFGLLADIAHYQLTTGARLRDGDTIGGSQSERILIRHRPSFLHPERIVCQVQI